MAWKDSLVRTSINKNKIVPQHRLSFRHCLYWESIRILLLIMHCLVCLNYPFQYFFTVSTTSIMLPSASGGKLCNGIIYNSLLQRYADNIIVSLFLKLWVDSLRLNLNEINLYGMTGTFLDQVSSVLLLRSLSTLSFPALNLHPGHTGRLSVFEEHHIKA